MNVILLLLAAPLFAGPVTPAGARLIGQCLPVQAKGVAGLVASRLAKVEDFGAGYGLVFLSPLAARLEAEGFPEDFFATLPEQARRGALERVIAAESAAAGKEAERIIQDYTRRVGNAAAVLADAEAAENLLVSPYYVADADGRARLNSARIHFQMVAEMIRSGRVLGAAEETVEALGASSEAEPFPSGVPHEASAAEREGELLARAFERVVQDIELAEDEALTQAPGGAPQGWRFLARHLREELSDQGDQGDEGSQGDKGFDITEFSDIVFRNAVDYREALVASTLDDEPLLGRLKRLRAVMSRLNAFREAAFVEGIDERKRLLHRALNNFMLLRYDSGLFNGSRVSGLPGGAAAFFARLRGLERLWKEIGPDSPRPVWERLLGEVTAVSEVLYKDGDFGDRLQDYRADSERLIKLLESLRDAAPAAEPEPPGPLDFALARMMDAQHSDRPELEKRREIAKIRVALELSLRGLAEWVERELGARSLSALAARMAVHANLLVFDASRPADSRLGTFPGGAPGLSDARGRFQELVAALNEESAPSLRLELMQLASGLTVFAYDEDHGDGLARFKANGQSLLRELRTLFRGFARRAK